jgi:hypothetical protein
LTISSKKQKKNEKQPASHVPAGQGGPAGVSGGPNDVRTIEISREKLGRPLGKGSGKLVYPHPYRRKRVIVIPKAGAPANTVPGEMEDLRRLREYGVRVPDWEPVNVSISGSPARLGLDMDQVEETSEGIKGRSASDYLNAVSIEDLKDIKRTLIEESIELIDFQLGVYEDGHVVGLDPWGVIQHPGPDLPPHVLEGYKIFDDLIKIADENVRWGL